MRHRRQEQMMDNIDPQRPVRIRDLLYLAEENTHEAWARISIILARMETERVKAMNEYLKEIVDSRMYESPNVTLATHYPNERDLLVRALKDLSSEVAYVAQYRTANEHYDNDLQHRTF
jgi:hypothetical protein